MRLTTIDRTETPLEDVDTAYRAPVAANIVGITYRQLDYWARTGTVVPSLGQASGYGSNRLYSWEDLVELSIARELVGGLVAKQLDFVRSALAVYRRVRDRRGSGLGLYLVGESSRGWFAVETGEIDVAALTIVTVLSVDWLRLEMEKAMLTDEASGRPLRSVAV